MDGDFQFYFTLQVNLVGVLGFFFPFYFFYLNQSQVCVFHHSNVMALNLGRSVFFGYSTATEDRVICP